MERITGPQLRAARALLALTAEDLGKRAEIDCDMIRRLEASGMPHAVSGTDCEAVLRVLAASGVTFTNDGTTGVTLRRSAPDLDRQISKTEDLIAGRNTSGPKTPDRGMELVRLGNDENQLRKLKAARRLLDQ